MFVRLFAYTVLDDHVWTVVAHETEASTADPVLIGEGTVPNSHDPSMARDVWRILVDASDSAYHEYKKQREAQRS